MRYAQIKKNDTVDGEGICVSYWAQGCAIRCDGCHNSELWDFNGGTEIDRDELCEMICNAISKNGIKRNFSMLGGEPMALPNIRNTNYIAKYVRNKFPDIKIYLWTGFTLDQLKEFGEEWTECFEWADVIIDGPYIEALRDITLHLRGSSNQNVNYKGVNY